MLSIKENCFIKAPICKFYEILLNFAHESYL